MKKIIILVSIVLITGISLLLPQQEKIDPPYSDYMIINFLLHSNDIPEAEFQMDNLLKKQPYDPFIITEKAIILEALHNDRSKAKEFLKHAIKIYPGYYYSNFMLASILFNEYTESGKKEKAQEAMNYVDISLKDEPNLYESRYLAGMISSELGDYKRSNDHLKKAARLEETPDVYNYMAYNFGKLKNLDAEIKANLKIMELAPSDQLAASRLAQIYVQEKDFKKALVYLEPLYNNNQQDSKILVDYLYALFFTGGDQKFLEVTKDLDLKKIPEIIPVKAIILGRLKKYDEAKDLILSTGGQSPSNRIFLAQLYIIEQDFFKAYKELNNIDTKSRNSFYYTLYLQVLSVLGMNNRAVQLFEQVQKNPELITELSTEEYSTVLIACAISDKLNDALSIARYGVEHVKENKESLEEVVQMLEEFKAGKEITNEKNLKWGDNNLYTITSFYKTRKMYDRALAVLEPLSRDTDKMSLILEIMDIMMELKPFPEVEKMFKDYLQKFPGDASLKNAYAYYLATKGVNLAEALSLSEASLAVDKKNPAYLDTYGFILLRSGKIKEAGQYLEQAYQRFPFDKEIIEHLTEYYLLEKTPEKTVNMYKLAIDNGVDFKEMLKAKLEVLGNEKKDK